MRRAWRSLVAVLPGGATERLFRSWVNVVGTRRDPREALRELLRLDEHLQREIDIAAIRLDEGVHAKHRLTRYHDFFVDRIRAGDRVLDVGTGKGELAHDIAERAGARVVGIDVNRSSLAFARANFARPEIELLEWNVLEGLPTGSFNVVVLSNVLEHLDGRVDLLRRLAAELNPRRILIRVPAENRHWHVPLRRELGLPWFSDPGHVVEYDERRLLAELAEAGLEATDVEMVWGELWAEARPRGDG